MRIGTFPELYLREMGIPTLHSSQARVNVFKFVLIVFNLHCTIIFPSPPPSLRLISVIFLPSYALNSSDPQYINDLFRMYQ